MWITSPFLLPVLLLIAALVATGAAQSNKVDDDTGTNGVRCQRNCGGVEIPYPFGIGDGCFRNGFEIICDDLGSGSGAAKPRLLTTSDSAFLMPVVHLSVAPRLEATVMLPASSQCYDSTGNIMFPPHLNGVRFASKAYRISSTRNELYVLGCNTLAYTIVNGSRSQYTNIAGCVAFSRDLNSTRDGACESIGCCHVQIPGDRTDNFIAFVSDNETWSHRDLGFCPCDYAFIVERGKYTFNVSDLISMPPNKTMPVVLDGAIRYDPRDGQEVVSCAQAKNKMGYACRGDHTECFDSDNGPGYICNCTRGYEGNPYTGKNGECINIDECARPAEFPCHGICKDTEGSYECECPPGHVGDPTTKPCTPTLPRSAKIGIGIGVGILLLIVFLLGTWLMFKQKELKAKQIELEQATERKNGSERLKNVKTLILFTPEQLYKITKNNSIPLGRGGFGQVYKGTLEDNTEVAVKASILVNEDTVNEFVREVEIQSRMMHRNILRLLGCCLRVDVPLLVYEYVAKGTLQDILHGKETDEQREPLPLDSRLDIAIGSAQGLAYMHSFTENGIQHADVKPSNILIDAGLVPKISDFGLSKIFNAGKDYTMDVRGHLDYMDPSSIHNRRLTKKGDVYSFGIVLLELICRKPVVYDGLHLLIEYMKVYEQDRSGRAMFDKEITKEEDILILEEIGMLAMKCLKENDEERPAMVTVASALVMLKDSWGKNGN